ncbi:auxin-induced protein, partial [Trifolium medium]|nr:auxin-induced protein [Trifolium medium]
KKEEKEWGFGLPGVRRGREAVPKGCIEGKMKQFVIPIGWLNQASFQELLSKAEQEFGILGTIIQWVS